jgi:hypothetical protein
VHLSGVFKNDTDYLLVSCLHVIRFAMSQLSGVDKAGPGGPAQIEQKVDEVPPPIGTTFVLSLYFLLLMVMWLLMFFGLLGRA